MLEPAPQSAGGFLTREITLDDAAIAALLCEELGYPVSTEVMKQRIDFLQKLEDHVVYVACLSGEVVGWIEVCVRHSLTSEPRAEISGLIVASERRERGVGRRLLARAEVWAVSRGIATMLVRSRESRLKAHHFYEREGYIRTKTSLVFTKKMG